jgi:hypothetical protein
LDDQLKYIPAAYRRGQVCNDVDIQRRQQQYEKVAIPERYTTTVGVENQWNNQLQKAKSQSAGVKKKTFDISGQICITESTEGYNKDKQFVANDKSGKTWGENVAVVGDHCDECDYKKKFFRGGSDSDCGCEDGYEGYDYYGPSWAKKGGEKKGKKTVECECKTVGGSNAAKPEDSDAEEIATPPS